MKMALLSNVNIDMLVQQFSDNYKIYTTEGYNTWVQEVIDSKSGLYAFKPEVILILLDGNMFFERISCLDEGMKEIESICKIVHKLTDAMPETAVMVSTLDIQLRLILSADTVRPERVWEWNWYNWLTGLASQKNNVHIFDLKAIVEKMGREAFYSSKLWYSGSIPYSIKAMQKIVEEAQREISFLRNASKKILVTDLDNTLWGGVIGEDGLHGIRISDIKENAVYRDLQLRLRELKEMGVILAVASKNNKEDVLLALDEHKNMVLKSNDFAVIKADWNDKASNIVEIAEELNVGTDSIVFLDDNPVEREVVRTVLPDVTVLDFPKDISKLPEVAIKAFEDCFFTWSTTNEDVEKTKIYREEFERRKAMSEAPSIDQYIRELNIKITLFQVKDSQIERVAQLTQKTNQFNLTTLRCSVGDIAAWCKRENHLIISAAVNDRYGDSGLVAVSMIHWENETACLDNFFMSCRVMGRHIEDSIFYETESLLKRKGIKKILGRFVPTLRNKPVEMLLERMGYSLINEEEDGSRQYVRNLIEEAPKRVLLSEVKWEEA